MTSPPPLKSGVFYHIYNRGANREDIFVQERNYRYFLQLYTKHIEPSAETYAYAKAINKAYGRTGSLFQHPFGRIPVLTQPYLIQLVRYIHLNPQKHGLVADFRQWPYSSYQAYLSNQPTRLQRDDVLGWFDGAQGLVAAHQIPIDDQVLAPLTLEDFD